MRVLYRGFDGLDVSFRGQISREFSDALEAAKNYAQGKNHDTCLSFAGLMILVGATGARGGYAYRASTGATGATWFFKRPNPKDPWGVRVSCSSFMLAENGLGRARARIYETMARLGIKLEAEAESVSRIDYAVDVLAPDLALEPGHFVMHSNANRTDHFEEQTTVNGKSGRVSSVTVGKMPGRQVIVYDKRAEAIARHKWSWFEIWNAGCKRAGIPDLNIGEAKESRVWRIEIRAGKRHLKDDWSIRSWIDLDERIGDLLLSAVDAVRLTQPNHDKNRSRWPEAPLWRLVRKELAEDLFELCNFAPPGTVKRVQREVHLNLLARQSMGLIITRAAIEGIAPNDIAEYCRSDYLKLTNELLSRPAALERKLAECAARYEAKS